MSVKQFFLGFAMVGMVLGSFAQEDSLRAENARLKRQLEEYQNLSKTTSNDVVEVDEEELMAEINKSMGEKDFILARKNIDFLLENYPNSLLVKLKEAMVEDNYSEVKMNLELLEEKYSGTPIFESYASMLNDLKKMKIGSPDKFYGRETDFWEVNYFVDNFGEKTNQSFVTNTDYIKGTFSNSATQNSKLNVTFIIKSSSDIAIQLYEYAGNNPVKASSAYSCYINVKGSDNTTLEFQSIYSGSRLSLKRKNSQKVHELLMKGGTTKFFIYEAQRPSTQYNFVIEDKDNIYRKINGSN